MTPAGDGTVLRISFDAQFRVGDGLPICTEGSVALADDGSWMLTIARPSADVPVVNLAGQATTPAGVITETIRAALTRVPDRS